MGLDRIWKIIPLLLFLAGAAGAETPPRLQRWLEQPALKGSSVSFLVKEVKSGRTLFSYDSLRQVAPASVWKVVTTATALELLGKGYRYRTTLAYDGQIVQGSLKGNLYIEGSGDPTLGSAYTASGKQGQQAFLAGWTEAIRRAGIRRIEGRVIADDRPFDTEGISPQWISEDLGNYYGAGSYGLNCFDNRYTLHLQGGKPGRRPTLTGSTPDISPFISFHNYLRSGHRQSDSAYIAGAPYSRERFLYGEVPALRAVAIQGDLPDPPLFFASYLTGVLEQAGIPVTGTPTCRRLLQEAGRWKETTRHRLCATDSPPLSRIIRITNTVSHNLYADALLKTVGLRYRSAADASISSFERGMRILRWHWAPRLDLSTLRTYDGSGLSPANRVSAAVLCNLLRYMANESPEADTFIASLPLAGREGSVRNFLKGSPLEGKARLKSGSLSRVRCYAGYITAGGRTYALALLVNSYNGTSRQMTRLIEELLIGLFQSYTSGASD